MGFEFTSKEYKIIFDAENPMLCFRDMIEKNSLSIEQYLDTVLDMDIIVDTGDSCSEFMMNTLSPSWGGRIYGYGYHISDYASIAWLTHQQGYKKQELNSYMHKIADENKRKSLKQGYLYSAAYEIWHELSDHNALCFLTKMKLKDALLLATLQKWGYSAKKWNGYVILDKNTTTGFYDSWSGSGSLMEIQLEKDVKLPVKYIRFSHPDCTNQYPVKKIWCNPNMWDNGGIKLIHMPKHFRRDLEKLGFESTWINQNISNYVVNTAANML